MPELVIGNVYDKYQTRNPVARRLFRNFAAAARRLVQPLEVSRILEAGCGEGHFSALLHDWQQRASIWGFDLSEKVFDRESGKQSGLQFSVQSVYQIGFPDASFDLVVAVEVLEHLDQPERALLELRRVARRYVLLSVPREPLWRLLNLVRLAYLRDLGNTPGHVQHWSSRQFVSLVRGYFEPLEVLRPLPWTMVLARKS